MNGPLLPDRDSDRTWLGDPAEHSDEPAEELLAGRARRIMVTLPWLLASVLAAGLAGFVIGDHHQPSRPRVTVTTSTSPANTGTAAALFTYLNTTSNRCSAPRPGRVNSSSVSKSRTRATPKSKSAASHRSFPCTACRPSPRNAEPAANLPSARSSALRSSQDPLSGSQQRSTSSAWPARRRYLSNSTCPIPAAAVSSAATYEPAFRTWATSPTADAGANAVPRNRRRSTIVTSDGAATAAGSGHSPRSRRGHPRVDTATAEIRGFTG